MILICSSGLATCVVNCWKARSKAARQGESGREGLRMVHMEPVKQDFIFQMDSFDPQLQFWLRTDFQNGIEVSLQLNNNTAPEETPYLYKYEAIALLKKLHAKQHPYGFILDSLLGEIYAEVQQTSDSVRSYQAALLQMSKLTPQQIQQFAPHLLAVYNMLGLSYLNRDQNEEGLGCFAKAMDLYQLILKGNYKSVYHNRSDEPRGRTFHYYYQGGVNHEELENSHTLTLFYLAQAYTKFDLKDKAAEACGKTLQRQYATNKYEVNEFCYNLIGLSQYYSGKNQYAQGTYLLMLGMEILPADRKKKMRAKMQTALGELIAHMLSYCADRIREKKQFTKEENEQVNKAFLLFEGFKQGFPKIDLANNLDECKSLFRKSNTQLKKALEVFVIDGYVTEHIDLLFVISKLYHNLCKVDKSRERVCGMLEKRREMLEPLLTELNPKAFPATWQKILVECSEIYNDLFQIRTLMAIDVKDAKYNELKFQECARLGTQLIKYYNQIVQVLTQDTDVEKNEQYYRSIINSKFNVAKTYSKMYSLDRKIRVEYLKNSWSKYQEVAAYIKTTPDPEEFEEEAKLTKQMIDMMPNKIDRINYGQISPIE